MKLKPFGSQASPETIGYMFYCPGCNDPHPYYVKHIPGNPLTVWTFNGDMERPTFSPSLLVYPSGQYPRCHLFLTDGQIQFCGDSGHSLAGQTVPLPDWPYGKDTGD
jgi:Tol biopolymer transport system component